MATWVNVRVHTLCGDCYYGNVGNLHQSETTNLSDQNTHLCWVHMLDGCSPLFFLCMCVVSESEIILVCVCVQREWDYTCVCVCVQPCSLPLGWSKSPQQVTITPCRGTFKQIYPEYNQSDRPRKCTDLWGAPLRWGMERYYGTRQVLHH